MIRNYLFLCIFVISICFLAGTVAREAIIGGIKVSHISLYPYQVSVQIDGHGNVCGGCIIGDHFILTAAHCVLNRTRHLRSTRMFVLVGTDNLNRTSPQAMSVQVKKVFFPKEFHPTAAFSHGDIAVLKLSESLQLEHHGKLRKLELLRNYEPGSVASLARFGWTELLDDGSGSNNDGHLRVSLYNVLSNSECEESYPRGIIQSDVHICAKYRLTPYVASTYTGTLGGACHGDAGSPLVYNRFTVIGILSRIPSDCVGREQPAVYVRVKHYFGMIHNVMEHGRDSEIIELSV